MTFISIWFYVTDNTAVGPVEILHRTLSSLEPGSQNVIVIDSLSSFMMMCPEKCYKAIHNLVNQPHKGIVVMKYLLL